MRSKSVPVALGSAVVFCCFAASVLSGQAVTIGGGVGALGVSPSGSVAQVAISYDAPLHSRARWWAGVHAGRDADPGVASPGIRQSVSEMVVSGGPLLPVHLTSRATAFLGVGGYGVVRRYGVARSINGGPALTDASSGGGDWGGLGRAGIQLEVLPRWGVMIDSQLRIAVEGSERRQQPAFSLGLRREW